MYLYGGAGVYGKVPSTLMGHSKEVIILILCNRLFIRLIKNRTSTASGTNATDQLM
jgi:hypothetical protein